MANKKVFGIDNANLSAAKQDFERFHRKFALSGDIEREVPVFPFESSALKIVDTVFREYSKESAMISSDYLEQLLYNETQHRS